MAALRRLTKMLEDTAVTYAALQSAIGDEDGFHTPRTSSPHAFVELKKATRTSPISFENKQQSINGSDVMNDENAHRKPPGLSYIALISMAIQSSVSQKMLLSEIYQWIADRYPYYQMKDKSWRNSIRHNLSLNECFVKSGRSENGKGNYWSIHPANVEDFAKGDYRRRRARRRVRICDKDMQRLCSNDDIPKVTTPVPKISPYDGYIPMASTVVPSTFMTSLGPEVTRGQPDWYPPEYYHCKTYDYKPLPQNTSPRDTFYPYQGNMYQQTSDYFSQGSTSPYYSQSNALGTSANSESRFNVNVNVNVCGSGSSSQQPSPQQPPTSSHVPIQQEQQQQQKHQQYDHEQQHNYSQHFQSAYASHHSHVYGTFYQDHVTSGVI